MATYKVLPVTHGQIFESICSVFEQIGIDCGFEITVRLFDNHLIKGSVAGNETFADAFQYSVPSNAKKEGKPQ